MTPIELAEQCVESLNHPERSLPDKPLITLSGKRGGLFPKGGGPRPKRLLCVNYAGQYTYHYDAMNVLAALAAHGIIEVILNEHADQRYRLVKPPNDSVSVNRRNGEG